MKTKLFKVLLLGLLFYLLCARTYSNDSIPVSIYSYIFDGDIDEWLHLKISDTVTNQIWYDSLATVTVSYGFADTIYLDSGTYKCEILDMGANVSMPLIILNNGYVVPWGYPAYEYYLFSVPGGELNTYSTITETVCFSYTSPSSKYTWTESGTYLDTIPNYIGYDSIITINLTVVSIDNSVNQSDGILTAIESDADYQWLTCNTGNIINGAINQSYTPIVSGLYSVRITKNGCIATSSCYSVVLTSINKYNFKTSLSLHPNPVCDNLFIDLGKGYNNIKLEVKDICGRNISSALFKNQFIIQLNLENFNSGFYFIQLKADNEEAIFKVLKK